MASIFTYEPDPPRVASPWVSEAAQDANCTSDLDVSSHAPSRPEAGNVSLRRAARSNGQVTHLQAEPQEGPVEYKLHLLLRPRRRFKFTSTGPHTPGSRHSKYSAHQSFRKVSNSTVEPGSLPEASTPPSASTQQTRQHRLEQLTTQLIWRLQQSSPHHSSSASNVIMPASPATLSELQPPQNPVKLLYGLEESHGALYEIGVSDDGTLVGLAEDEMQESLNNLRAMATCLGCTVEILREEIVGECEWFEDAVEKVDQRPLLRTGKLLVAEALIKPHFEPQSKALLPSDEQEDRPIASDSQVCALADRSTEQLRVTLTGATMSGKSSLLGTLTTSTLDNGRGKSRSAIIKHRHEIDSGVTSSVTQELLGYSDPPDASHIDVINYATENAASWIDIHAAAKGSRLVFVSDSAGHPRYRRTTVRSLVGWAPHWTLLCVPADDTDAARASTGPPQDARQNLSSAVSDMDLSSAQLDLCLKIGRPLVVVITKLDLASKAVLRSSLTKLLDALKAAGRTPMIVPNAPSDTTESGLQLVSSSTIDTAYNIAIPLLNNPIDTVPIILTSSVQGTGISSLHALLHELPISAGVAENNVGLVFHIEDVFTKPVEAESVIVSGRIRSGQISIGDTGFIGPFSVHDVEDSEDSDARPRRKSTSHLPTSRSFPGALRAMHSSLPKIQLPNQEWRRFKVASVRNLRLPVHTLHADQVGTVAIVPDDGVKKSTSLALLDGIRKGMVLTSVQPQASSSFVAEFQREKLDSLAIGNHVVVYLASVRASARIVSARAPDSPLSFEQEAQKESNGHGPFDFGDLDHVEKQFGEQYEAVAGTVTAHNLLVTFNFNAGREFIMLGDQVLVMPGGGPGLYGGQERGEKGIAGLEGFVGKITEVWR